MNRLIILLLCLAAAVPAQAQSYLLPSRPHVDSTLAPFFHGVASGDPLTDRVILWTRVTTEDISVSVDWQIASDTLFANVISSGTVSTDTARDHTVKVDAAGLSPNRWYYYRFKAYNKYSAVGRTRTAPSGNTDSLRFAIVACSNFQAGFFNVYHDIANRNDIDAVLHLGDYYYEYKQGGYGYLGDTNRLHPAAHDAFTMADYRIWHSQYKLDPDLRACHQQYPFITIWDDHETANDSYHDGAENHNSTTEGDWFTRKDAGKKAYFEWMPIREVSTDNDTTVRRTERWGDLIDFIMLDTRYEGRDSSLGQFIPDTTAFVIDTNRQLLGRDQLQWFKGELSSSAAKWRIIGNQVMIAPLTTSSATSKFIINGDQWDGYPAERRRVLNYIMQQQLKNIVFITGDIHCSWGNDIPHPDSVYDVGTGSGSVATEFVTTSVTSPSNGLNILRPADIMGYNPHVKYVELNQRGYLLLDVNKQRIQGDWLHVNTVTDRAFNISDDGQWMNVDNERFLRHAPAALAPRPGNPPLTPVISSIGVISNDMIIMGCYPNPAENEVAIQYYLSHPAKVIVHITDMSGRVVYTQATEQTQYGLYSTRLYIDDLSAGSYVVSISAGGKTYNKQVVKGK